MFLYHATPSANVASIRCSGLLVGKSYGRLSCVWAVRESALCWAIPHVADHQGVPVEDLAVVLFDPETQNLIRSGRPGVVRLRQDVPTTSIRCILSVAHVELLHMVAHAIADAGCTSRPAK